MYLKRCKCNWHCLVIEGHLLSSIRVLSALLNTFLFNIQKMKTAHYISVIGLQFTLLCGYAHCIPHSPNFMNHNERPTCNKSDQITIKQWFTEALKMVQYVVPSAIAITNPAYKTFIDFQGEQKTLEYIEKTFNLMKKRLAEGIEGKDLFVRCGDDKRCNDEK